MSDQMPNNPALRAGTRVRVRGFPTPTDPFNSFDFNGKVGEIQQAHKVGRGLNQRIVYAYDVYFKGVEVPFVTRDPEGRIKRERRVTDAANRFEEEYLEVVE